MERAKKVNLTSLKWSHLLDMVLLIAEFALVNSISFGCQTSKERMMSLIKALGNRQKNMMEVHEIIKI